MKIPVITIILSFLVSTLFAQGENQRIVSIGGAATEIVFALGAGDQVVAVDLSSTYPEQVRQLPQVGYIRQISPEGVLSLQPDLVVTTESMGPPAAKEAMKRVNIPVIWCPEPDSPEALYAALDSVGASLDRTDEATAVAEGVRTQLATLEAETATWPAKPKVLFFIQPPSANRPGMAAGQDTRPESLIALAGGTNAAQGFKRYQPFVIEAVIAAQPDVILLGSGAGHGAGEGDAEYLLELDELQTVPAVKNGRVHTVPMDDLNFGPRLGDAANRWSTLLKQK